MFIRRLLFWPTLLVLCAVFVRAQTPTVTKQIPATAVGASSATIDLRSYFSWGGVTTQVAQFDTALGKFNVELYSSDAPLTVANFLSYVSSGAYNNSIIHRSIPNFIIQGGGYAAASPPTSIPNNGTVAGEVKRSNVRGTLAMARVSGDINSANTQWYFNLVDNNGSTANTNLDTYDGGYTVFGKVLGDGMTVVDAIAALPTYDLSDYGMPNLPLRNYSGTGAINTTSLITVNSITSATVYPTSTSANSILSFTVSSNNNPGVVGTSISGSTLTLNSLSSTGSSIITVRAKDTTGAYAEITFTAAASLASPEPAITQQPADATAPAGTTVAFRVEATGDPAPVYQWRKNNQDINGATDATLVLRNVSASDAANYSVAVTNRLGSVTSRNAALTVSGSTSGRLINLSVLHEAGAGVTMGFVIRGNGSKRMILRGVGPTLANFGVSNPFPDPRLQVFHDQQLIDTNEDWSGGSATASDFDSVGAFALPANSKDAAARESLADGNYSAKVLGPNGTSGLTLVEAYDGDSAGNGIRLINLSALTSVGPSTALTAGFVIRDGPKTLLIRGVGPSLASVGVTSGYLPDPMLTVYQSVNNVSSVVATNDNWGNGTALSSTFSTAGAFNFSAAADSVVVITLPPGQYSATVSTVNNLTGTALIEIYEIQ